MKKKQTSHRFATAVALVALALGIAVMDVGTAARADTSDPDFLVLNPERD
jgi:hypothetical protein